MHIERINTYNNFYYIQIKKMMQKRKINLHIEKILHTSFYNDIKAFKKSVAFWIWDYKEDFNSNYINNSDWKSYEVLHIVIMYEINLLWLYMLERFFLLVIIRINAFQKVQLLGCVKKYIRYIFFFYERNVH